ncbi:Serine/threonine-protein kinase 11-interacting protein [Armadillidium nasatum]|uniref:Serine/threonine-protein kinase 11-interacting protein n=1 Tax=Armadillidium nasatum TaxID=96803 RepID=A0A5N5TCY8_9CRUS|nr:Serine/threonine-protein kinase 11-interacting protein [Armadillidium nasatum]
MATEYLWENLETANFSGNHLGHLDSSLRLLPAIKELDLSYCELVDAISLFCLPTITKLNLSYNQLTSMPALSENASNVLQSLNLSNNLIVDLRGIERFITLEELNLKGNLISVEQTLVHLNDLANLKNLNILRNPVTHGLNYRNHVIRCLHSSIRSCEQFILDDTTLLFSERKVIGAASGRLKLGSSSSQLLKCLIDSINNILKGKKTNCNRSREPPVTQLAQPSSSFYLHKSSTETEREESSSPDNTTTTNKLPPRGEDFISVFHSNIFERYLPPL